MGWHCFLPHCIIFHAPISVCAKLPHLRTGLANMLFLHAAVPPPDPKKFTDEELAKIGIHMANRLHPDDTKGQSNWADIDDDDEDWAAPEAITWTDGTKTTIPHVDESAQTPEPTQSFQHATLAQPVVKDNKLPLLDEKPHSPAPIAGSPSVKPAFASGKGLVLKGASSEKPTLVAKPPAPPTPVKSPWAQLPPVSKVSPMEVPNESMQRAFPPPGQGYGSMRGPAPPMPAREIAADDFSRSPRRDNQQLFNSQSGRYEPVPDRRGMSRTDYPQRGPAVLQRPIHSDSQGPAEPSAAFQTTHTSGGYGRRRGSSNVSGGSGSFARMGRPYDQHMPPTEMLDARRSSFASAGDHPVSPHNYPPSGPQPGARQPGTSPYQQRASPAMSFAAPQIPDGNAMAPQQNRGENTVEFQKRLMQERRAEAIKRRQEQEAKEEAEKKERLAKKLAALGPAPERKSTKKEDGSDAAKSQTAQPSQVPETTPAQAAPKEPQLPQKGGVPEPKTGPVPNGVPVEPQGMQKPSSAAPEDAVTADNKHGNQWQPRMPNQPERIWGTGGQATRNVWGAPNNDRTLGNGTFGSAGFETQSSQAPPPHVQTNRPAPGPIGPPRTNNAAPSGPSSRLGPIGPPQRNAQRAGLDDNKTQARNRWAQAVVDDDADRRVKSREQMDELQRNLQSRGMHYSDLANKITDKWTETNEDGRSAKLADEATYQNQNSTSWPVSLAPPHATATQNGPTAGSAVQQSRFFPSGRDLQQPEPLAPDTGRPPEEGGSHPAFDGDALHPHVSLPRTKPIVKLPPTPAAAAAATASQRSNQPTSTWGQGPQSRDDGAARGAAARSAFGAPTSGHNQGPSSQIMDRIKNLFADNKPTSVNSSSRTALSHAAPATPATVSLPVLYAPSTIVDDKSFVTKTMDEDCFEEQEMGSLPPVHIPTEAPEALYAPARNPPRLDRRLLQVTAATAESLSFNIDGRNISIQLPNASRKTVPMAAAAAAAAAAMRSPNSRRGTQRASSSRYGSSHRGGGGSRHESSTPYSPEQAASASSSTPGRGRGYRGRSENWGRSTTTAPSSPAIQTQ